MLQRQLAEIIVFFMIIAMNCLSDSIDFLAKMTTTWISPSK